MGKLKQESTGPSKGGWNLKIRDFLISRISDIEAIYIFGSASQGAMHPESDIDIAVLCKKRLTGYNFWEIGQELASKLDIDVDLIDLREASTIFQHEILVHGKRIFFREAFFVDQFETVVFSEYTNLIEIRAPLIQDIQERGSVYDG